MHMIVPILFTLLSLNERGIAYEHVERRDFNDLTDKRDVTPVVRI